MLGFLSDKMQGLIKKLVGSRKLTEDNIQDAVREVRIALLEADVNYSVVKTLIQRIKEKAVGDEVLKSVTPGQQFVKVVHDELVKLMGDGEAELLLKGKPATIMLCGLQGSGKTTAAAKLARYLFKTGKAKKPLLIACDLQRPAAVLQLQTLGQKIGVSVFTLETKDPKEVAKAGLAEAKKGGHDVVIVDTAGRLHLDEALMDELTALREILAPEEILFVANSAQGQDAVNVAAEFNHRVEISGSILTMLDGSTRGGAAISIREVTGKPLKFEGIGEKVDDLQLFHPASMADRILGMGDTINLVRKAQEHMGEEEAKSLEQKIRTASFTYEDYLKQIQMVKKMGSLKGLLSMLPGLSSMKELDIDDKEFFKVEAIIYSMTPSERSGKDELSMPRRKRVAKGSGTKIDDVNRLEKSFKQAKKFFKNMPNLKQLQKMMGGSLWG
jgi:signal recognition particle subunit SRP54